MAQFRPARPAGRAAAALAATLVTATGALAADPSMEALLKELGRLNQRIEELERRKPLPAVAPSGADTAAIENRIRKLESAQTVLDQSLKEPVISADEPPLAARLKAVESQVLDQQKAKTIAESLEGIKVGLGLTLMGQGRSGGNLDGRESQLNGRADATVTLPGGEFADAKGSLFAHLRAGQGPGMQTLNRAFASVNATAFQRANADNADSAIVLAEAWYQLNLPLEGELEGRAPRSHLEITVGKMDPFAFFDQNAAAGDETRAFVNQAFVHNPLLDAGGDMGVDGYGFTPGLRLAYTAKTGRTESYRVSAGLFESGRGASFQGSMDFPFWIGQVETTQRLLAGLEGTYRLYGWRNHRGQNIDGGAANHAGFGVSFDQRVADYVTLFARYGRQVTGKVRFDQAITGGVEIGGDYWKRGGDALGLALGWLNTSTAFRRDSLNVDADGDGAADYDYQARGAEQIAELYYRYSLLPKKVDLTPSVQYLRHAGGNPNADDAYAMGLRLQLTY